MDRFELEGITYYQQGRKCGKEGCKCARGDLHGPYWYGRDQTSGKVEYIGRRLPAAVTSARMMHDARLAQMVQERRALIRQAEVLGRLVGNRALRPGDRDTLIMMGYKDCLVTQ